MNVPHSGNSCSGLCRPPCGHEGCWQCAKIVQVEAEKAVERQQIKAQKAIKDLASQTVRPGSPNNDETSGSYAETQITTISRAALQGLIDQVPDLQMDWNGGDPIIIRKQNGEVRSRKMNDVRGAWVAEGGVLAEAVKKISMSAGATIDQMVKDALNGPTPDTLRIQGIPGIHKQVQAAKAMQGEVERVMREMVMADERKARDVLKAQGASDEDIAAAAALLSGEPQQFITADMVQTATVDITELVKAWRPQRRPAISIPYKGVDLSFKGEFTDVE